MKDNISIIFATIIGTILIVILPLVSILDRQDSMAYNVVLTQTTKFVDSVRNNGFIDRDTYTNYLKSLTTTGNSYKVEMEIYRKTLIPATDDDGDVIPDTYVEEIELYNARDVFEVIDVEYSVEQNDYSNIKNNVYLLRENDEIYLKVYNTNITAGSVLYNVLSGANFKKVIDISYGGVINNINWELFNEIDATTIDMPEVIMEVPVNAKNMTNIMKVTEDGLESIDCEGEYAEVCEDFMTSETEEQYTYFYDLTYKENKEMTIAVELKNMDSITVGENADGSVITARLDELTETQFNLYKDYIIENYIRLNEMDANIDLEYRGKEEYYMFDIKLTNVSLAYSEMLSTFATVVILPGLGQNSEGTMSIGAETVRLELQDFTEVHIVTITDPINWKKLLQTEGQVSKSTIRTGEVYYDQELAFIVSYTGINEHSPEEICDALRNALEIGPIASYKDLSVMTTTKVQEDYGIDLNTRTAGRVIIKLTYTSDTLGTQDGYVKINPYWITTNIVREEQYGEEEYVREELAYGTITDPYVIRYDGLGPKAPSRELMTINGVLGNRIEGEENEFWYKSTDVIVTPNISTDDLVLDDFGVKKIGGSGVWKNTIEIKFNDQTIASEKEIITSDGDVQDLVISTEGKTTVTVKAYDYVGNYTEYIQNINLDKTPPTEPTVEIIQGDAGSEGWYKSNVVLRIVPGKDSLSGVKETTYRILGAGSKSETKVSSNDRITLVTLDYNGESTIYITTYDNAGNYSEAYIPVKIDKTEPAKVDVTVVGQASDYDWYSGNVGVDINIQKNSSPSGFWKAEYEIVGTDGAETESVSLRTFTETKKHIDLSKSGRYIIRAFAYNNAGNRSEDEEEIAVDSDEPNVPTIEVVEGIADNNLWYKSPVTVKMISNGDVGPSGEKIFTYKLTTNGRAGNEKETTSGSTMDFTKDGKYVLKLTSYDFADNSSSVSKNINIDTTPPTKGKFVVEGTKGANKEWYVSDVTIKYTGASDATSKIASSILSHDKITSNTNGTQVTMTITDNAGNTTTDTTTIKLDKTLPTEPTINLLDEVTGTGMPGVYMYNKDVNISITEGDDDNKLKTTYMVTIDDGETVVIDETEGTELKLTENGLYTVTATTYDKAGNTGVSSKTVYINKDKPEIPNIASINQEQITSTAGQTVVGTSSDLIIVFDNLSIGNKLDITLIEQTTLEKQELTVIAKDELHQVIITLSSTGTYKIITKQTNIFGSESETSVGNYYYQYEEEKPPEEDNNEEDNTDQDNTGEDNTGENNTGQDNTEQDGNITEE